MIAVQSKNVQCAGEGRSSCTGGAISGCGAAAGRGPVSPAAVATACGARCSRQGGAPHAAGAAMPSHLPDSRVAGCPLARTPCLAPPLPRPTRQQVPGWVQVHHVLQPRGVHGHELAVPLQLHVVEGAGGGVCSGGRRGSGERGAGTCKVGGWQGATCVLCFKFANGDAYNQEPSRVAWHIGLAYH